MLSLIDNLPEHVVGVKASGTVSGEDYEQVLIPAVESALSEFEQIRLLYHITPEFKRFTTTALWDDAKVGVHHLTGFERVAIVTDIGWLATMARGLALAMPKVVQAFDEEQLGEALSWINE